jgi:hypothetical protein
MLKFPKMSSSSTPDLESEVLLKFGFMKKTESENKQSPKL